MSKPYNLMPEILIATVRCFFRAGKRINQDMNQLLNTVLVSSYTPIHLHHLADDTLFLQREPGCWRPVTQNEFMN